MSYIIYVSEYRKKGPYGAKTKLKLRVDTPVRVNPVQKIFLQYDKELPFPYLLTKFEVQPLSRKCLKGARTPPTQTPTQKLVMVAVEY